ncbi:MAG: hypothetical protein GY703_18205 [Gammaproteobacteria bacterium]|nr:hypothetical protein [Gammaproteobacteria bacterium]
MGVSWFPGTGLFSTKPITREKGKSVFRSYSKLSIHVLVLISILFLTTSHSASATTVVVETTLGKIPIELFDADTPLTVANFLGYVADGDYTDSFFHRSMPGFVIQGGGFVFSEGSVSAVPKDLPVANEFQRSNIRGTVAMAKLGGDPDSATSQWFINLADNGENLDGQNGGFTVFGRVVGDGMEVADRIALLQVWNAGSPFDNLPLIDYSGAGAITDTHVVYTAIELDTDNDHQGDSVDNCVEVSNAGQENNDNDDYGDACDPDDDNDSLPDEYEIANGLNPFDGTDAVNDNDDDGRSNRVEYLDGTNPELNEASLLLILNQLIR